MEDAQAAPELPSSKVHSPTSTKGPSPVETHWPKLVPWEHRCAPLYTKRRGCQNPDWTAPRPPFRATPDRGCAQSRVRTERRPQVLSCRVHWTARSFSKC